MTVLHYRKQLTAAPPANRAVYRTRELQAGSDVQDWLDLRNAAMRSQIRHGRDWTLADFRREFLDQRWFSPACCWLTRSVRSREHPRLLGSLVLQLDDDRQTAIVRWLLVAPNCRRQGIGSHLLALAERAAWHQGRRQPACRFYESHGYHIF